MEQELAFRGIVHGMVHELDGDAPSLEFLQEKHLRADPAGRPVRGVDQQTVEFPLGRGVTQPVEGRPLKAGARVTLVHELGHGGVAPGLRMRPQGLQLAENGLFLFLTVGADPGVQRGSHRASPFQVLSLEAGQANGTGDIRPQDPRIPADGREVPGHPWRVYASMNVKRSWPSRPRGT